MKQTKDYFKSTLRKSLETMDKLQALGLKHTKIGTFDYGTDGDIECSIIVRKEEGDMVSISIFEKVDEKMKLIKALKFSDKELDTISLVLEDFSKEVEERFGVSLVSAKSLGD